MKQVIFALWIVLLSTGMSSAELSVDKLLKNHQEAAAKLDDVKAKAALSLQVSVGIIPYSEKLSGRYYYLKPDRHRLEFDDAPSYFDKAPSLFQWDLPARQVPSQSQRSHQERERPGLSTSLSLQERRLFDPVGALQLRFEDLETAQTTDLLPRRRFCRASLPVSDRLGPAGAG